MATTTPEYPYYHPSPSSSSIPSTASPSPSSSTTSSSSSTNANPHSHSQYYDDESLPELTDDESSDSDSSDAESDSSDCSSLDNINLRDTIPNIKFEFEQVATLTLKIISIKIISLLHSQHQHQSHQYSDAHKNRHTKQQKAAQRQQAQKLLELRQKQQVFQMLKQLLIRSRLSMDQLLKNLCILQKIATAYTTSSTTDGTASWQFGDLQKQIVNAFVLGSSSSSSSTGDFKLQSWSKITGCPMHQLSHNLNKVVHQFTSTSTPGAGMTIIDELCHVSDDELLSLKKELKLEVVKFVKFC
ncbi:unnamed protein product [Ambrosiozyma monospora]|uniref:Unnamed protein product n=1 Tax=Ambrosiozyma monospora TaxID=43982 RepID=A0ACB5U4K4_AMBMO|nr:unnamed protein product [Ambrosiozyma monospora]